MIWLLVICGLVVAVCLIYLMSLVDRLADAIGRDGERLKNIEQVVGDIKDHLRSAKKR